MKNKSEGLWNQANESLDSLYRLSKLLTEIKRLTRGHKAFSIVLRSEVMTLAATLEQIQIVEHRV